MGGMKKADFSEKFWPQDSPFRVSIAKVLVPKQPEPSGPPDAVLIKLKYIVSMPISSPADTDFFQSFLKTLEQKRSFCGLWTPEVSEPYYNAHEASVELTSYLRKGQEDRILHLDHVARASQERKAAETEDAYLVEQFISLLQNGKSFNTAVAEAEKKTRERFSRGERAEMEMESGSLAAQMELAPKRTPLIRPPPGPPLQKPAPADPSLPDIPPAEQAPSRGELSGAPLLISKEMDAEMELSHTEVPFDISLKKKKV
ncbi:MAG: hypothetical protein QXH42_04510 [Thermoplasmata archaeon]